MAQTKIKGKQLEQITSSNIGDFINDSAISAAKLVTTATDAELNYLSGVTSAIQTQITAKLAASVLKKSTDSPDWTSDLIAVTAKAIAAKIQTEVAAAQIGGAMVFKGAWSAATINSSTKAGWTFVYDSGTAPTGHALEAGDMLVAVVDNPGTTTAANWKVVQSNINGAVTYTGTAVANGGIVLFDGTTGKLIKGSALSGLLKLVNGVPAVATGDDLPGHYHAIKFAINGSQVGAVETDEEMIDFVPGGAVTMDFDNGAKKMTINVPSTSVANGGVVSDKYVSGMGVSDGVITLTFGTLPTVPAKTGWKRGVTPTGTLNGTNKVFTIPESITAGTEEVIINGQIITRGVDYTISAAIITLATDAYIPVSGDIIRVNYVTA